MKHSTILNDRQRAAYHEAGHVLFAVSFGWPFDYVTIDRKALPHDQGGGIFNVHILYKILAKMNKTARLRCIEKHLIYLLAGPAADAIVRDDSIRYCRGNKTDLDDFFSLCASIGLTSPEGKEVLLKLQKQIEEILDQEENCQLIKGIAKALLKKQRLEYQEILEIIEHDNEEEIWPKPEHKDLIFERLFGE